MCLEAQLLLKKKVWQKKSSLRYLITYAILNFGALHGTCNSAIYYFRRKMERRRRRISSPKASNGQRFPCPALLFPVEWGDFPFVRPSVHPSVRPSIRPSVRPPGWLGLRPGWMPRGGCTDERTKNLPILQDFVPMKTKEKVEQGKGTADHLMPLDNTF